MLKYISKRIIYLIPVLIGIVFLVFTIMYFSPGDPAKLILGDRAPEEQVAALRHELGLDLPYYQQLFNYIKNAIHGDFGNSYQLRMPVWDIIKLRFPLTLQLTTFTMLIAVLIGVPVGSKAVFRYRRLFGNLCAVDGINSRVLARHAANAAVLIEFRMAALQRV